MRNGSRTPTNGIPVQEPDEQEPCSLETQVRELQSFARLMKWAGALLASAAISGWLKVAMMVYARGQIDGSNSIRLDRTESDVHELSHRIERLEGIYFPRRETP